MSDTIALLHSLRAWPELWRHPRLFSRVHGAGPAPHSAELLNALLALEPLGPADSWEAILQEGDVAAMQTALAHIPGLGEQQPARARRRFERRVEQVLALARPLSGAAVARAVAAARAAVDTDAFLAEQNLRRAENLAKDGIAQALEALRQIHGGDSPTDDPRALRAALKAGDLRLAQMLVGQLASGTGLGAGASGVAAGSLLHDSWLDQQSTAQLLGWLIDPALAPTGRLPAIDFADHELSLLRRLRSLLEDADEGKAIPEIEARGLLELVIRSLLGESPPPGALSVLNEPGDDTWVFGLAGPAAARLFPHAVDGDGVALVVPRRPSLHFPASPPGRGAVIFDLFEVWEHIVRPGAVVMRPRMLAQSLAAASAGDGRAGVFVRLLSGAIAVRPLILAVLGRDEDRCRLLIGESPFGPGEVPAAWAAPRLTAALDLLVDDGDIAALIDAAGDRLSLMLEVLHQLAEAMDGAPSDDRHFNILDALLRPEIEDRVEELLETYLRKRLPDDQLTHAALLLDDVAVWLEKAATEAGVEADAGLPADALAQGLVAAQSVPDMVEGRKKLAELLSLGLLRRANVPGAPAETICILPALPLPGRILLRLDL